MQTEKKNPLGVKSVRAAVFGNNHVTKRLPSKSSAEWDFAAEDMSLRSSLSSHAVVHRVQCRSLLSFNLQWSVTSLVTKISKQQVWTQTRSSHSSLEFPFLLFFFCFWWSKDLFLRQQVETGHLHLCEFEILRSWRSAIASVLSDSRPRLQRKSAPPPHQSSPPGHKSTLKIQNKHAMVFINLFRTYGYSV